MSEINAKPEIRIRMKGLGVMNYNTTNQEWEILFLRSVKYHTLKISIYEKLKDQQKKQILNESINPSLKVLKFVSEEWLVLDSHYKKNSFNWDYKNDDPYDSRWVVNLSELYGSNISPVRAVRTKKKVRTSAFTLLKLKGAMLYTKELSCEKDRYDFRSHDGTVNKTGRNIALWIGFKSRWKTGFEETDVYYTNTQKTSLKPKADLEYYEIVYDNDCDICPSAGQVDFDEYFRYLVSDKVIIETPPVTPECPKFVPMLDSVKSGLGGKIDCHLIEISSIVDEHGNARRTLGELH